MHFIQAIEYEPREEGSERFTELTRLCATLRRLEVQGFVGRATERPTEAIVRTTHFSKGALRGPTRSQPSLHKERPLLATVRGSGRRSSLKDGLRPSWKLAQMAVGRFAVRGVDPRDGGLCGAVAPQDRLSPARRSAGRARGGFGT